MKIFFALCVIPSVAGFTAMKQAQQKVTALNSKPMMTGGLGGFTPAEPSKGPEGLVQVDPVLSAAKADWDAKWETLDSVKIQGGALRTWAFPSADLSRVYLDMTTFGPPEGYPLNVHIDLNEGPDNTPQTIDIYSGKGRLRPFKCWIETPEGKSACFIRNKSPLEFPISARVGAEMTNEGSSGIVEASDAIYEMSEEMKIQGGSVRSYDLDADIETVKITMSTDGRPLMAQAELIQGPNAPKYTIDIYTEDGLIRPFTFCMVTPGAGNTVRLINTAPYEFPLSAQIGLSTV